MIRIVATTEEAFWQKLDGFIAPRSVFEAQGDRHGDIDMRLVERIDAFLVPKIGNCDQSDRWCHNIDYYGDGIRSLEFAAGCFSPVFVQDFQHMLVGEHADFTVLCKVHTDIFAEDSRIGSIAVRSDRMLVAYLLVACLNGQL